MVIILNREYHTELIANTELHAGGLFFCIIFKKILKFKENNNVQLYQKVINPLRPMDEYDIDYINNYNSHGQYKINDRGYLKCKFDSIDLEYTGILLDEQTNDIIFHVFNKAAGDSWSEIFKLSSLNMFDNPDF
jgi:hypothetical protein